MARICLLLVALAVACAGSRPATGTDLAPFRTPPLIEVPAPPPPSLEALAGQARSVRFDHVPPEAGLSQSVVTDIVQDDLGFLWLATQDGLNRYDGYGFTILKATPGEVAGLKGNMISGLDKAPDGSIWIASNDAGLARYEPESGRFTTFRHDPADANSLSEDVVLSLDVDDAGIVWIGTGNTGLNRLDPATGRVTRYPPGPAGPSATAVTSVVAAPDAIWLGTYGGGLNRLDRAAGEFRVYRHNDADPESLGNDIVNTVYLDRGGMVWAGTLGGGLNRLDPASGRMTRYAHDAADASSLAHDNVVSVFEDGGGNLWVGTLGGGLNLLHRDNGTFTHFLHDPLDPGSVASDHVQSLYEDRAGILWVGTFGAGADLYDPYKSKFLLLRHDPERASGLGSDNVWSVLTDREGVLWVGHNDAGVSRFDPRLGEWRHFRTEGSDSEGLGSDTVFRLYEDPGGTIWAGTAAGLSRYDPAAGDFVSYPMAPVMGLLEDSRGRFWVGSMMGLAEVDRVTGAVVRAYRTDPDDPASLSSDAVDFIVEDADGRLWLATLNGGVNRLDPETGRIDRFLHDPDDPTTLSGNVALALVYGRDGTLWIGTTSGLNRYVPETDSFVAYREADGLPNDVVYGILEDDAGHLWLSTNKGLSHFDPRTLAIHNYDPGDGLQGSEFNQWAFYQNDEGVMFFGGVNGLNAFHPAALRDNPYMPPVVITGFKIANEAVPVGGESPLQRPVEVTRALELTPRQDFFEFEYAALDYSSPGDIRYAVMMQGMDDGWQLVGDRRFATYTNVPPGDYTFRVRATNSDGVWSDNAVALGITIPPPFWQTWWFRALAAVGLLGAVSGVFLIRLRSVERQRQQLERQVDERTSELRDAVDELEQARDAAEAASRAKSTFLANMSHEFRTPLNAIIGFTQILDRDPALRPAQRADIGIIRRSGEHLLGLINDVLEMSKIEAGRTTLRLTAFDLYDMLYGLEEMFALRAEARGLSLRLALSPEVPRYVRGDEGKLRQVLMNLLGNAVKFTQRGSVSLQVDAEPAHNGSGPHVRFAVADTGPGIAPDELEKLFEPFSQARVGRESPEGTGLGLAISRQFVRLMGGEIVLSSALGVGSTFAFSLPLESVGAEALERPQPARRVVGLAPGQPRYRLLAVDDQEVNRKILVRLFEPLGFEIREAANGREAVETWEAWEPHLIWMDMRMPVMDGYAATRHIKSATRGMATIIIALTASALEEDRAVILSEGCDDYIRKPFHEQALYDALERHLGVRFVYEDAGMEGGDAEPARTERPPDDDLAARLARYESGWLDDLAHAATLGDLGGVARLVEQARPRDPVLAAALDRLSNDFEHERILGLIDRARHTETPDAA